MNGASETPLWTSDDVVLATGGVSHRSWSAHGVSIDTRTLQPGDIFIALKDARDGHDFVRQALEKGAAAALVSYHPDDVAQDAPLVVVPDVLDALVAMGRFARTRCTGRVTAITGSVGKTSTKEMLRIVLQKQGKTHAAEASYNNHWGVPLTLARMPVDTEYAIIEIGMSAPGEIAPLAKMARPHVAMVTTVAAAHLEAFDNIAGIAVEKASILDGLEPEGIAVLNADIATADVLGDYASRLEITPVWFGHQDASWQISDVRLAHESTVINAHAKDADYLFKLSTMGRHFAMNAVGVLAVTDALGADPVQASLDIATWAPPAGRGTRETLVIDTGIADGTIDLIDDAFNANPTSMTAALEVLAACTPKDDIGRIAKGRRIAILGDMLELGPDEMTAHAALADDPHMQRCDIVHSAGPRMRHLHDALPAHQQGLWFDTAQALAQAVIRELDAGDVVLIKGSKGSKISLVVDALRKLVHRNSADPS